MDFDPKTSTRMVEEREDGTMDADKDEVDWEAEEGAEWVEGKRGDKDET